MRTMAEILDDAKILYDYHSCESAPANADFILVAGSHDLRVAEHASDLYADGLAPLIVCSGGFGKVTEGLWKEEEGAVFAKRCIESGVPEEDIFIEKKASNTGENFTFTKTMLENLGRKYHSGIIVCKPYMGRRALATGVKQWKAVHWLVNTPKISFENYPSDDTPLDRMINLMVGDLQRLEIYADKGFQVKVEIPFWVKNAFERLCQDGYTEFLLEI